MKPKQGKLWRFNFIRLNTKRLCLASKGAFMNNNITFFSLRDDGYCPCLMFDRSAARPRY